MKTRRQSAASIRPSISPARKPSTYPRYFQKLNRFLTGYDLRHVFNDDTFRFDLTRIFNGVRDAGVYY
ncbi:hypothetical protein KCP73_24630 [Salmonella enterica subsp. enterica]|nr:hypothetical protein KCP73_24630 [Salmonella enterica subsp. enterica]